MATDDKNRRPKFVDWDVDQRRPSEAIGDAAYRAGGGAMGVGAGTRELVRQAFVRPAEDITNLAANVTGAVVRPVSDFSQGFLYGGPRPSAPAATAPGSTGSWGVSSSFPTLRSVVSPEQTAPAPALTRTPSRGQPAPAAPAPIATTPRQTAPAYSMDSVPAGGGYMEWGDRGARGGAGSLSVTPQRARELSGQSSIVPAGTIPQLGLGSQPAYGAAQGLGRPNAPQRSRLIGDRSNDFDSILKNLVSQATREPDSYGELFRRKGVLNALNDIAGVAQGAGTNAAQDIANVRNNIEQRYSTDLTDQARAADRGVTTRGQDRLYESNVLRNNVMERNADLQAKTSRDSTNAQAAVSREGYKARSADNAATISAQERLASLAPIYRVQSEPEDQLVFEITRQRDIDGKQLTAPQVEERKALLRELRAAQNPLQDLLQQAK